MESNEVMNMIYRTVIWKNPDDVNTPQDVDRTTWLDDANNALSDFTTNYISQVTKVNGLIQYDTEIDYDTFKSKIDGATVTWSDVMVFETKDAYYLFVSA